MIDLISRQAAIETIDKYFDDLPIQGYYDMLKLIRNLPTIEPKRGRWVNDKGLYRCTACNNLLTVAGWDIPEKQIYKSFKFCPNCGAKMERSEDD